MFKVVSLVALGVVAAGALPAAGQSAPDPNAPPKVLMIVREEVKVGKGAAHEANEANWAGVFAKAQWPTYTLAATSVTGPGEAWYFIGYPSFEAWEKDSKAQETAQGMAAEVSKYAALDGDLVNRSSLIMATLREDLSYRPNINVGTMRYFSVETIRVKPGYGREFSERWHGIIAAHEKANMNEHWAAFQVESGAPAGTILFIYGRKSLAELDDTSHGGQAYRDAVGESGRDANREMNKLAVDFDQVQHYAFSPKMSYVPKAWVDTDPEYWTPKPPPAPAPARKTGDKK